MVASQSSDAKCFKKATVNLIDDSYDFNHSETNVIHNLERHRDEEEIGVFLIGAVQSGRKRKSDIAKCAYGQKRMGN